MNQLPPPKHHDKYTRNARPRSIRFSGSGWSLVEWAAVRRGIPVGKLVRKDTLAFVWDRLCEASSATISIGRLALIEATWRVVHVPAPWPESECMTPEERRNSTTSSP